MPLTTFLVQKFCSKECVRLGQKRYSGEDHPYWKPGSRRRSRSGRHRSWASAVINRDNATCRSCGISGVEMHAHHVKSFADHPDLRFDPNNGVTLCHKCHWRVHSASNANGVNSGNILPGKAGDNPEPSDRRKPIEGVTTRGRAYRRTEGSCEYCGKFISKRFSDAAGKAHLFCSKRCSAKYQHAGSAPFWSTAVTSSTSAPPERDDIV